MINLQRFDCEWLSGIGQMEWIPQLGLKVACSEFTHQIINLHHAKYFEYWTKTVVTYVPWNNRF